MGTPLFYRRTRGVELTNPGKLLLEEARVILKQVEQAKTDVKRRARGETGRINIGSAGATYFHPLIPAIIREYRTDYPDVVLLPQASNTTLLIAQLRAGCLDIAIVRPPLGDSEDDIALDVLGDEPAVMVVPTGHPLSRSASAPLRAFAKETFVLFPRAQNPGVYDSVVAACRSAGFSPILGQEAPQIVATIPLVAAGLGVAIVPRSMNRILPDAVVYLPIDGAAPRALIALAHRYGDRSPAVQNFVAVARQMARSATEGKSDNAAAELQKAKVPRH